MDRDGKNRKHIKQVSLFLVIQLIHESTSCIYNKCLSKCHVIMGRNLVCFAHDAPEAKK